MRQCLPSPELALWGRACETGIHLGRKQASVQKMYRKRWQLSKFMAVMIVLGAVHPLSAATPAKVELFELINQRLALMTKVADYKYTKKLPVEDLAREKKVLASARHNAALVGLDPDSVQDFFISQITAAKNIQRNHLLLLEGSSAPTASTAVLESEIRPELLRLGNAKVSSLARLLESGDQLSIADWPAFQRIVATPQLGDADSRSLFDGLLSVRSLSYPPPGFVYVKSVIPDIALALRYLGSDNFVGQPVDGYINNRLLLTGEAAQALKLVQDELKPFGLGLKVFDGYRPQRAVDHFVRWAEDLEDQKMKSVFYPDVDKAHLFSNGYIAARSSHTRGSAVDLTVISLKGRQHGPELDMGSSFDFFGPLSWPADPQISAPQRANRLLLRALMQRHGFMPYPKEWWHFTLIEEPFADSYFDFPVQ